MFDDFQDIDEESASGFDEFASSYDPDEPEGLVEPRLSSFFVGHENVDQELRDLINSGAMPHALIFSGQQGIGKSTMAFRLARCLFKNGTADSAQDSLFGDAPAEITSLNVGQDDPVFSRVASGGHSDLLTIGRAIDPKKGTQKDSLDVDTARKVTPFLRMTSSDGGWRVVIVDDADTMNRNAQNAMLKILEEPPKNTILILVCHRLGAMIPTIRSRCRVINFNALAEEELDALMTRAVGSTLSDKDKQIVRFLGQGSIGRALKLIDSNGLEVTEQVLALLENFPCFNWVDIHHMADQCGRAGKDSNFKNVENAINAVFEALVFAKAKGSQLDAPLGHDVYAQILSRYSLIELTDLCDKLKEHFRQARFSNLDKRQAVLGAFNMIQ